MSLAGRRLRDGSALREERPGRLRCLEARDGPAEVRGQVARGVGGLVDDRDLRRPGGRHGGSAMPWGLVLPAARAKLVEGDCEPEVRLAALSNW